jgi:hypothetical protein
MLLNFNWSMHFFCFFCGTCFENLPTISGSFPELHSFKPLWLLFLGPEQSEKINRFSMNVQKMRTGNPTELHEEIVSLMFSHSSSQNQKEFHLIVLIAYFKFILRNDSFVTNCTNWGYVLELFEMGSETGFDKRNETKIICVFEIDRDCVERLICKF